MEVPPLHLSVENTGNCYVVGMFSDSITFGNTTLVSHGPLSDIFLVAYDPAGQVAWVKQAGGNEGEWMPDVAAGPGGDIWVSGSFFNSTVVGGWSFAEPGWWTFQSRIAASLPSILVQPENVRANPGQTATFWVTVTNASNPRFQWSKDGVSVADDDRISGSTDSSLMISNLATSDAGNYSVTIRADNGTVSSSPAALRFGPLTQFVSKTALTNGIFKVNFVGEPGRFYNIEASTKPDFQNAVYITNFFCGEGTMQILDWHAGQYSNRFYRAVSDH